MLAIENFLKRSLDISTLADATIESVTSRDLFERSMTDSATCRSFTNVIARFEQLSYAFTRQLHELILLPTWAAVLPFLALRIFLAAFGGLTFEAVELWMGLRLVVHVATPADDSRALETDPRITRARVVLRRSSVLFDGLVTVGTVDLHSRK